MTAIQGPADDSWQRRAIDRLGDACQCLDSTHEDLSRQRGSLRQWVREFAWLRNRTRGHGAPRAATLSRVCPALLGSIQEVVDGAPAFQRSWAYLHRNFSGKYRVSTFGGPDQSFAYLSRDADSTLPDGSYVFLDGPRPVRLLYTDSDLSDFFVPNGNFRGTSFETLSYITDEVRPEDGGPWTISADARPPSETTATPHLDVVGNAFTNMPPRREGYVRRADLESSLGAVLIDGRHPVVTLQGRGGVGKTSLALEVLHSLAESDQFFAIIWFSARDIDLLEQGPRVVRSDVMSTEDVARDFSRLMRPSTSSKLSEDRLFLTECLSGNAADGPFLFVLDNFETIRDPAELYSYLDNAVRPPNKVLITTRTRDFKADYPIEVRGMSRQEFAELVADTAARLNIVHLMSDAYQEQLFEEADGHPYITKVLLGEVAKAGQRISPKRVVATKDAMLDALFDRSFATLSPSAQRVFLTLCSWHSIVPRLGLEAVLLRPANERLDVEQGLTELEQASLVEVLHSESGKESFLSVPLAASLFGRRKLVTSPFKIAIEADVQVIRTFGATTDLQAAHGLGPRVERMARAAAARAEAGSDLTQELAVIEYIATAFAPAWLTLAELQENQLRDTPSAIRSTMRYLEAVPDDHAAWSRLVRLYRATGDATAEMNARLQLAQLGRPAFAELTAAASRLNGLLSRREITLDADEKRLMVRRLRSLIESRQNEADATDMSRLAWLCMHDQDQAAARSWVEKGLEVEPQNQHCQALRDRIFAEHSDA